jgi:hypothetical protein
LDFKNRVEKNGTTAEFLGFKASGFWLKKHANMTYSNHLAGNLLQAIHVYK